MKIAAIRNALVASSLLVATAVGVQAQNAGAPRTGWVTSVDGLALYQGRSQMSEGGHMSASRAFLRVGGMYLTGQGASAGVSISSGKLDYDFDVPGEDPWGGVNDLRLSAPIRFRAGDRANVFIVPSLRWDYQDGAKASDGQTWGVFGGVSWRVNDSLSIGPAFGAFSKLQDSQPEVFPALLINWKISQRLALATGQSAGATQGPGLSLSYQVSDVVSLSLAGRYESLRFRLDDTGVAPGGVGQDRSMPVVLTLDWKPKPFIRASVFAGAEFNGQVQLEDNSGVTLSEQDYETAPVAGFAFRLRF
jgi:hypothetical protein